MRKILFVSYEYPPVGAVGVMKTLAFTRHVQRFGWEPIVIACANQRWDRSITGEPVPPGVTVHRTRDLLRLDLLLLAGRRVLGTRQPSAVSGRGLGGHRSTLFIDPAWGWFATALRLAKRLVRDEGVRHVYCTMAGPLLMAPLIGLRLKREFGDRVKVIVGMQDFWTGRGEVGYPTPLHRAVDALLEKSCLTQADGIVVVSEAMVDYLSRRYPELKGRIHLIYNGVEEENIPVGIPPPPERFTILNSGTLYFSTLLPLVEAVNALIDAGEIERTKVRIVHRGPRSRSEEEAIRSVDRFGVVEFRPVATQKEAYEEVWAGQVLYLAVPSAHQEGVYDKTFGYLASGNPIIASVPDAEAKRFIGAHAANAYFVAPAEEPRQAVLELYRSWERGELKAEDRAGFVSRFSKRAVAGELARRLDGLT